MNYIVATLLLLMPILSAILLLFVVPYFNNINTDNGCLKMDIVVLLDMSGSVNGHEEFIGNTLTTITNKFYLSDEGIMLSAYQFNSFAKCISPLTSNKMKILSGADSIKISTADSGTNLYNALELSKEEFSTNGRDYVKKLLVIVTDGSPDAKSEYWCKKSIWDMKKIYGDEFNVAIIAIENDDLNIKFINEISDYYFLTDYDMLIENIEKLDLCF